MAHRREDYPEDGELPWLDRPDALDAIDARVAAGELDEPRAERLRGWHRDGYLVLEGVLDEATTDAINADVDRVIEANRHLPIAELRYKFQDIFPDSEATRRAMSAPVVLEWIDLILGVRALPYQTLNLPVSSQQGAHSDQILMTTHPPGYLAAAWFALEDVGEDAGPLYYLPGSHRLSYVGALETGIPRGADEAESGRVYDANYYEILGKVARESGLPDVTFLPKRGDVLLWHSNLIHGGRPTLRQDATRKSLIVHYFGEGAEHYSDLFGRGCNLPDLR